MFELTVETTFSAAHAITLRGEREPLHGHDWHVTACIAAERLDDDALLVDFHTVHRHLLDITAPFRNTNLNDTPPFDHLNPTAENVARHIAVSLAEYVRATATGDDAARRVRVAWVRVTEAAGCAATYRSHDDRTVR